MIPVLNNLTEDYDVVLDGTESKLMLKENDPNTLTMSVPERGRLGSNPGERELCFCTLVRSSGCY